MRKQFELCLDWGKINIQFLEIGIQTEKNKNLKFLMNHQIRFFNLSLGMSNFSFSQVFYQLSKIHSKKVRLNQILMFEL